MKAIQQAVDTMMFLLVRIAVEDPYTTPSEIITSELGIFLWRLAETPSDSLSYRLAKKGIVTEVYETGLLRDYTPLELLNRLKDTIEEIMEVHVVPKSLITLCMDSVHEAMRKEKVHAKQNN